jgi:predicted hydrocarbon binding protein
MIETLKLEEGQVTMCDLPIIFSFTKSIYYTQKELEKVLGDKWKRLIYECGKNDAMFVVSSYLKLSQNQEEITELLLAGKPNYKNKVESLQFCGDQFNKMGLGYIENVAQDVNKLRFVLRFYFSPIGQAYLEHEKTKEPVCHYFSGLFAGTTSIMYPGSESIETKCIAKGDPYCEFELRGK